MTRPYDLILFGATGFTGALVAESFARRTALGHKLSWALGGRSLDKLATVRESLAAIDPKLRDLPLIQADAADSKALGELAQSTHAVVTTVGPYLKHGLPLAKACAEAGTDYCDLTGETPFVRQVIDQCHATARGTGARLIPCAGFDSIPSDLGVWLLHRHFQAAGKRLGRAKFVLGPTRGQFSGGSTASALNMIELGRKDPALRELVMDPYGLNPDRSVDRGKDGRDPMGVSHDPWSNVWTAPFVMGPTNTRVVRRTNALLGHPYGTDFRYEEVMGFGRGLTGVVKAASITAFLGTIMVLGAFGPTRRLLERLLPKPGSGPSRAERDAGYFKATVLGWAAGDVEPTAACYVEGTSDPGYGETAKMLSEVALLLLETRGKGVEGGVLTPASALGDLLQERLRGQGMRWDVEDLPNGRK